MEHVELETREHVHKGTILDVYADTVRLPNGNTEHWDFVSIRKGAAAVLPVLDDGRIVLVNQYRHALERMTWEIPAGSKDFVEEDALICAARELEEETGYRSDCVKPLLTLRSTVAFCNERIDVCLATNLKKGKQHLDEAESIEVKAWSMEELLDEIYAGRLQDAKTVSAILAYRAMQIKA